MKILQNLFDNEEFIENEDFLWNLGGTEDDVPRFWWKRDNIQVTWYSDDPGRGSFTNQEEFTASDAVSLLWMVRESYDLYIDGK